jgi:glycosyltransferase involved in cell wall biosynthesis
MTRIALMVNCLATGGAETQLVRLAFELDRMGHDVRVLSLLTPMQFTDVLADAGIPLVTLDPTPADDPDAPIAKASVVRSVVPAIRTLRAWRPQALVCFIHEASLYGRFVGRLAGVPVVIGSERNVWREGRLDAVVSRCTDHLLNTTVVNAPAVGTDLVRRRIVRRDTVQVIPNGIDVAAYGQSTDARTAVRREVGAADNAFVWVAVGRLTPQKNFPQLLHAFSTVIADRPSTRLLIAGSGTLRGDLDRRARELDINDRVLFLGERDDVPRLLAAADALVMSSVSEGLPNVVMEALAARLPVVATDVGGVSELVVPERTGTLVPPDDPAALASAMLDLMDATPDHRAALGRTGHEMIAARYGMPEVARQWVDVIEQQLGAGRRRRRPRPATPGHGTAPNRPDGRGHEATVRDLTRAGSRLWS